MSWMIDQAHTQINFSVRHMMISTVRGRFERFSGTVEFNESDPTRSSVDVTIETDSINTREPKRDAHLRSPDFLDAENYPTITFKSKRIEKVDDNHGRIIGDLTINGATREVTLETEYFGQVKGLYDRTSAGFAAKTRINRSDFGLTWNVALETGGWLVGDEIQIDIDLEMIKQEEESKEAQQA